MQDLFNNYPLRRNKLGFFEVKDEPLKDDLAHYYSQKYYQETPSKTYAKSYEETEKKLIEFRIASRFKALQQVYKGKMQRFLDVGCGEGFVLKYFLNQGVHVEGLDFSHAGVLQQNPDLIDSVITGDVDQLLHVKVEQLQTYDIIWLQNVLEHVIDPVDLMAKLKKILADDGVLVLTVPNDFSPLQLRALDKGLIDTQFWVTLPDHLSYFNTETLLNFVDQLGWQVLDQLADFPIDWFVMNEQSNYVSNPKVGVNAHLARLHLETLIAENHINKVNQFYRALSVIGMGRNTVLFLRKNA
ncbi:class I SAM-dependent methyltransferase [Thiomicrospira microaerophila]|uniref:class I SAM-dependent methyltransferase n=1 Tax=Thiomicrospira microaerophila TaxID=406020 RepID=UPI0005C8AF11|nr:class I SAM-dependent methyltransferase [Thiomicrospira microaerophila]